MKIFYILYVLNISLLITGCRQSRESLSQIYKTPVTWTDSSRCDSVVVMAGPQYRAGFFKRLILGSQYRKEWAEPIVISCLRLEEYSGGLTPVKRGGGKQTRSIRLRDSLGQEFNFRSVDKDPSDVVPGPLRGSFLHAVVRDLISSAHPYGMLMVPALSEAAGIPFVEPQLYYMPYSAVLDSFLPEFGGMTGTLELRPDGNLQERDNLLNAPNTISTFNLYEKLQKNPSNRVNSRAYAKARLFDMFINDWDRHEDQWRWAEFPILWQGEYPAGTMYVPIPRDRDQAFVRFNGIIPYIISRPSGIRYLRHFKPEYDDLVGLNLNGSLLDRMLLAGLTKNDWIAIADSLMTAITDEAIMKATQALPPAIYPISGSETESILRLRREKLRSVAATYYRLLAKRVDIPCTDKNEKIYCEKIGLDSLKVSVCRISAGGLIQEPYYSRVFSNQETSGVIIHPMTGNDEMEISSTIPKGMLVVVYGGDGNLKINGKNPAEVGIKRLKVLPEKSEIYIKMIYP